MVYDDLTPTMKRRFNANCICPICHTRIYTHEEFLKIQTKRGQFMLYFFFHLSCLRNLLESEDFA